MNAPLTASNKTVFGLRAAMRAVVAVYFQKPFFMRCAKLALIGMLAGMIGFYSTYYQSMVNIPFSAHKHFNLFKTATSSPANPKAINDTPESKDKDTTTKTKSSIDAPAIFIPNSMAQIASLPAIVDRIYDNNAKAINMGIIAAIFMCLAALATMWFRSRMTFVWFAAVTANRLSIREGFSLHRKEGGSLFLGRLVVQLGTLAANAGIIYWIYLIFRGNLGLIIESNPSWMSISRFLILPSIAFVSLWIAAALLNYVIVNTVIPMMALQKKGFFSALGSSIKLHLKHPIATLFFLIVSFFVAIIATIALMATVLVAVLVVGVIFGVMIGLPMWIIQVTIDSKIVLVLWPLLFAIPCAWITFLIMSAAVVPYFMFIRQFGYQFYVHKLGRITPEIISEYKFQRSEKTSILKFLTILLLIFFLYAGSAGFVMAAVMPPIIKMYRQAKPTINARSRKSVKRLNYNSTKALPSIYRTKKKDGGEEKRSLNSYYAELGLDTPSSDKSYENIKNINRKSASDLLKFASKALRDKRYDRAEELAEKALAKARSADDKYFGSKIMAEVLKTRVKPRAMVGYLEEAIAIRPYDLDAVVDLSDVYAQMSQYDKGIAVLDTYLAEQGDSARAFAAQAAMHMRKKEPKIALKIYKKALRTKKDLTDELKEDLKDAVHGLK